MVGSCTREGEGQVVGACLEEGGDGEREVPAVVEYAACFEEVLLEGEEGVVGPDVFQGCPVILVGRVCERYFAAAESV